jgi:exoribonuclease-2
VDLAALAAEAMRERGLAPEFPPEAMRPAEALTDPARAAGRGRRDLTGAAWCSTDNDDTRDFDQLTLSEDLGAAGTRVLVAVADVDAAVDRDTPMDAHARLNTTSAYTAARTFPMLPERPSADLTSLVEGEDRLTVVAAFEVDGERRIGATDASAKATWVRTLRPPVDGRFRARRDRV